MATVRSSIPPCFYKPGLCGLYILPPVQIVVQVPAPVPLRGVSVDAHVVDLCTRTVVSQLYQNQEAYAIEAVYIFPLDNRSAICDFEVEINGAVTKGIVQEKETARATYEAALAHGDSAQLLEQKRSDVFQMNVGNLRPGEICTVSITYVCDLRTEGDAVKFFIPTFIAPRYNPASEKDPILGGGPTKVSEGLAITVAATMAAAITAIHCPTHPVKVTHAAGQTSAIITLDKQLQKLDKDFELLVTTAAPHDPRIIIEHHADHGPAAVVSLVPKFELEENKTELIFVVDRSGSMSGWGLEQARKAMQLFLRSLPIDCYFNIVGFGSRHTMLWAASQRYSQDSLSHAAAHVTAMCADLGGTELMAPLRAIFNSATVAGYARQVFVLTDGQVSNTGEIITEVGKNNRAARVFSLGLGSGASHELVEGIARAGKGTSEFVITQDDRLEGKVIAQLGQATQPALEQVTIEWEGIEPVLGAPKPSAGVAGAIGSLLGFKKPTDMDVFGYAQAPFVVPPVFSGSRFLVFCLLSKGSKPPSAVVIKAQTPDGPLAVRLEVKPDDILHEGNVIHTLAARALIQDLEDGKSWLHDKKQPSAEAVRKEIVRLGLLYKLASKHTSFVAVQQREHAQPVHVPVYVGPPPAAPVLSAPVPSFAFGAQRGGARKKKAFGGAPMTGIDGAPPPPPSAMAFGMMMPPMQAMSRDVFAPTPCSALPPCFGSGAPGARSDKRMEVDDDADEESSDELADCDQFRSAPRQQQEQVGVAADISSTKQMEALVALQLFDGSWGSLSAVAQIMRQSLDTLCARQPAGVNEQVFATAVALAFLQGKFSGFADELRLVINKGKKWLGQHADGDALLRELADVFSSA